MNEIFPFPFLARSERSRWKFKIDSSREYRKYFFVVSSNERDNMRHEKKTLSLPPLPVRPL